MSVPPDILNQIIQGGLLNYGQPNALDRGLMSGDPSLSLGLNLLANSNTPGNFGSIFGKSLLGTQQQAQQNSTNQVDLLTKANALQLQQTQQKALADYAAGLPGGGGAPGQQQAQQPQMATAGAGQPSAQTDQPQPYFAGTSNVGNTPVNGMDPNSYRRLGVAMRKDPLTIEKELRADQMAAAQDAVKSQVETVDTLIQSDKPAQYVQADPRAMAVWRATAPRLGMDPLRDFNDQNVRTALTVARNQAAGQVNLPAIKPNVQEITKTLPDGRVAHVDPLSGKTTIEAPSTLVKVVGKDGKPVYVPEGKAAGMQPYNDQVATQAKFAAGPQSLLGALAMRGISLPAGLRSQQQQIATLQGMIDKYPDLTPDQIADKVGQGQISFNSEKKAATVAAGIAGKTATAENEIQDMAPTLLDASAKVPRGDWLPVNKLLQLKDSDLKQKPELRRLKIYVNSMLNAYDQLAARGGTDKDKRGAAHKLLESADSDETLRTAVDAFGVEAGIAKHAAEKAAHLTPNSSGGGPSTPANAHPADIQNLLDKYGG